MANLTAAAADILSKAARAAQQLMKDAFGINVQATGHWGSYTRQQFDNLRPQQQDQVKRLLSAYNADIKTIAEIAMETSATAKGGSSSVKASASSSEKVARFQRDVVPVVISMATAMGFKDPKLAVAQLAHESRNGASESGKYNYGGVKARASEPASTLPTTEYVNGKPVTVAARFKDYPSPQAFVQDFLAALARKWPGTLKASNGNEYAKALVANPKMQYYTAPQAEYAAAVNKWRGAYA